MRFQFIARALCLDFTNTIQNSRAEDKEENLSTSDLQWAKEAGLLSSANHERLTAGYNHNPREAATALAGPCDGRGEDPESTLQVIVRGLSARFRHYLERRRSSADIGQKIWMKKFMVLCLSLSVLTGCKKKPDASTSAKLQQGVTSGVPSSPTTPPAASTAAAFRAKASELQATAPCTAPPKEPSLGEVLVRAGLKHPPSAVKDLDQPITSYAALNDPDAYVIAYYWNLPSGGLEDPLRVLSFNRQTEEWQSAQLMLGSEQIGHSECVGAVLHAHALPTVFLFDTHITPSAGCLLILERNLAFRNVLYGWYLAAVGDTQIVFQRSEVHFAPVHPTELSLYDLKTNRETSLFPRKPFQRVRAEYTAKLADFYRTHQEWCKEHNDPCDAERVDSTLDGEVAVSEPQQALAFVISYDRIQDSVGPVQKPEGPGRVVYVYRHIDDDAKLDYREMLLSDIERRGNRLSLGSLLEPASLHEIFASSSAN